jgi:uncharacterized membrane protein YraQ (UPF0718 family)
MIDQIYYIAQYIIESFLHTWPYLLVTIPIAVAVKMSGASKHISRVFTVRPVLAVILATLVGAFSPLCSCSVIPVIAAMLIGGVPLAPVMSFWLASPSMDPEIFFLTVSSLGWELAAWRLAATLILSLGGGFATLILVQRGWLGTNILRSSQSTQVKTAVQLLKEGWQGIKTRLTVWLTPNSSLGKPVLAAEASTCSEPGCAVPDQTALKYASLSTTLQQSLPETKIRNRPSPTSTGGECAASKKPAQDMDAPPSGQVEDPFWQRLGVEVWEATTMVVKFMLLAWLFGALIRIYFPEEWIINVLGTDNPWSILTASVLGVPVYTSNLAAMPLVGGLLDQGMHPAAALAFLISGPMTTLPAMSAVWGLVNRKVFSLYIAFALVGAVVLGYVYHVVLSF